MKRVGHTLAVAFWFVLAVVLFAGCQGTITPPPPAPPPSGHASCADVCANGRRLGCTFVELTANGGTCEQVCQNVQDVGIASFDLDCRAAAPSCAAVDACP